MRQAARNVVTILEFLEHSKDVRASHGNMFKTMT